MRKIIVLISLSVVMFANDIIVKQSNCSVDETINKLSKIVKSKGLSVFTVVDHKKNADGVNMKLNESKLIIFGNPKVGTALMQQDITIGLDLPLKVLVYKDNDSKVKMAYRNGSWIEDRHKLNAPKKVKKINGAMDKFTTKAGSCGQKTN